VSGLLGNFFFGRLFDFISRFLAAFFESFAEIANSATKLATDLTDTTDTEQQYNDDQNYEKFWSTNVHDLFLFLLHYITLCIHVGFAAVLLAAGGIQIFTEITDSRANFSTDFRDATYPEEEEDDHQNNEEFRRTNVHEFFLFP